ncbi:MAG: hypothetical protein KKB04_02165, partial [Candidatus Thermoplasmatota archaeon]|nr:hypothetical protein [Candidatus Thermoplasmatota archaeon]
VMNVILNIKMCCSETFGRIHIITLWNCAYLGGRKHLALMHYPPVRDIMDNKPKALYRNTVIIP